MYEVILIRWKTLIDIVNKFFKQFLEDISPFCEATGTPVLNFGDVCPVFQSEAFMYTRQMPVQSFCCVVRLCVVLQDV